MATTELTLAAIDVAKSFLGEPKVSSTSLRRNWLASATLTSQQVTVLPSMSSFQMIVRIVSS